MRKDKMTKQDINPVRLRLELKEDYLSDRDQVMLKRYGESTTGNSLVRNIIIPSDMPLHNLHYAIQRLFGWRNSHLREFLLPKEVYDKLTNGTVKGWSDLVGVLFQPPSEGEIDVFWDDDFDPEGNISFTSWLRNQYIGPYEYGGHFEHPEVAQADVQELLHSRDEVEVRESFQEYSERSRKDGDKEVKIKKRAPMIDLTLEELKAAILIENGTDKLLESLLVDDVLGFQNETAKNGHFPATDELIYHYDFGASWIVHITKHENYDDLLEQHLVFPEEIEELEERVLKEHKPFCLHLDGLKVIDDISGLSGFAEFLETKYEHRYRSEDSKWLSDWAKSMGWRPTKIVPKKML
jgi:hypothetical protein